ncbi:MAG: glycine cleavage system protein GcvH [Rhodocyclaceae bacterium]
MNVPQDLRYTRTHEWAKLETDGLVSVGITDHAQELLGDIVFLELPQPGRRVAAGEECAVVESVKAASDIYAPLSGEVVAVNGQAAEDPASVNREPYGAWLFRLRPDDAGGMASLLDAAAYGKQVESESH